MSSAFFIFLNDGVFGLIQLQGVSKLYANDVIALKDVDITIQNGEFVFIVGQSGTGKSTLVKLLLKEEEPSEGTINERREFFRVIEKFINGKEKK